MTNFEAAVHIFAIERGLSYGIKHSNHCFEVTFQNNVRQMTTIVSYLAVEGDKDQNFTAMAEAWDAVWQRGEVIP